MYIEIEPIAPYPEDVQYPRLSENGSIELVDKRPDPLAVHTAGQVLDDAPLDQSIPFKSFDGAYAPGERALGFAITRVGDSYRIPRAVEFYGPLAAQMLGALNFETGISDDLVYYYLFGINEASFAASGGGIHPDELNNESADRSALASNILPTWYPLGEGPDIEGVDSKTREVDPRKWPPDQLWCPPQREIVVQQGQTLHCTPICPPNDHEIRRLAELRQSGSSGSPIDLTRIMVDDAYFTQEDALKLLIS